MDQVYFAEFSLADRMGHIVYDDNKLAPHDILSEIDECGFESYIDGQQEKTSSKS